MRASAYPDALRGSPRSNASLAPGLRSVGSITLVKEMMALQLDEASVKVRTGLPDDGHGPGAALGR